MTFVPKMVQAKNGKCLARAGGVAMSMYNTDESVTFCSCCMNQALSKG